jgi:uncharacterized membrane protein
MNKMRFAAKVFAGALATTVLVLGSLSAPAQAAKPDTGWGVKGDTGWGVASKGDTGWG